MRAKDKAIVDAIASGLSTRLAAEELGVSESTVTRVRRKHRDAITAASDQRWESLSLTVARMVPRALATLVALMESPHDAVRLGAAGRVIDAAIKLRVQHDLAARLEALEDTVTGDARPWEAA